MTTWGEATATVTTTDDREQHTGAYVLSGVLLVLYGLVPVAWVAYSLIVTETPVGDFLEQLVNPVVEGHAVRALTPYEWGFAVALIAVGVCALARRRAARGGALLLSFLLLFVSIREGVGLLSAQYREWFDGSEEGGWILATRAFGLVVAVVVIPAMLRAREPVGHQSSPRLRAAGALLLLAGLVMLGWIVYSTAQAGFLGEYLLSVVDPSDDSPLSMASQAAFYDAALTVGLLVVGTLAVLGRRAARGASFPLLGVIAYLGIYRLVGLLGSDFVPPIAGPDTILFWTYVVLPLAVAVIALPLMAIARDRAGYRPSEEWGTTGTWAPVETPGQAPAATTAGIYPPTSPTEHPQAPR